MAKREITADEIAPPQPGKTMPGQRKPPESGQFHLQIDRQTKSSFTTYDAAEKAALAIKTAYPIVHVAVYDTKESLHKVVELPAA